MDQKKIGAFIADRRRELGLTQAQLAERLNVTDKAVSKWETGRGLPDASLFQPLCDQLGVSLGELFAGETVPPADLTERTEQAAIGLFLLVQEWGRQRRVINAAFFAVLALDVLLTANALVFGWGDMDTRRTLDGWLPSLDLMLLFLGAAFARSNRDSRPIQWGFTVAGAVLLASAVTALILCAVSGAGSYYRADPLYLAGLRAGMPCAFLFWGFFCQYLDGRAELFFLLMAALGLACLVSGARSLRALRK